ncbi:MAG: hypothetical protein ACP5FH_02040 [Terracidiphilus sp.]
MSRTDAEVKTGNEPLEPIADDAQRKTDYQPVLIAGCAGGLGIFPREAVIQMARTVVQKCCCLLGGWFLVCVPFAAQQPQPLLAQLNTSGQIVVDGRSTPYLVRHLPVSSFPGLPAGLVALLNRRGCLIPQTFEAYGPENVVHASLQRAGSSDWAVLCSAGGTVSLLVYFSSAPDRLQLLAAAPETERLAARSPEGPLGFDWGIDRATPRQVHDAQAGMDPRPPLLDHDALADSIIHGGTVYHFYSEGIWTELNMPE